MRPASGAQTTASRRERVRMRRVSSAASAVVCRLDDFRAPFLATDKCRLADGLRR